MAQFGLHGATGSRYMLDCQADTFAEMETRPVVPLLPAAIASRPSGRLNPVFEIRGVPVVMMKQLAVAVPLRRLGPCVASLADDRLKIIGAIDVLTTGF